ncbi:MAG: hypothetical protein ACRER2_08655 [Methylococcales bacterium]
MPFGQSAVVALVAAELSGLLIEHMTELNPKQINFIKGVIAFIAGEATALPTVDAIGGTLTLPIAIMYIMRAFDIPKELQQLINIVAGGEIGADREGVFDVLNNALA